MSEQRPQQTVAEGALPRLPRGVRLIHSEAHGGRVSLTSRMNAGTTVIIQLPIGQDDARESPSVPV